MNKILLAIAVFFSVLLASLLWFEFDGSRMLVSKGPKGFLTPLESLEGSASGSPEGKFVASSSSVHVDKNSDQIILNNIHEIEELWQEVNNCCEGDPAEEVSRKEAFYKACMRSIERYPDNQDIGAYCLWLAPKTLNSKSDRLKLHEQFMRKYFDYDMAVDECEYCGQGDISARVAMDLADEYRHANRMSEGLGLLERMNDKRNHEMADWLLAEFTIQMAWFYKKMGKTPQGVSRIWKNYIELMPRKNEGFLAAKAGDESRFDRLEKAVQSLTPKK